MDKTPPTIDNLLTDAPETEPAVLSRVASIARAAWALLRACAELFGIGCFLQWLLEIAQLV